MLEHLCWLKPKVGEKKKKPTEGLALINIYPSSITVHGPAGLSISIAFFWRVSHHQIEPRRL